MEDNNQRYIFDKTHAFKDRELDNKILTIIGHGIKYPFSFSTETGGVTPVKISRGIDKINGSIHHILSTPIGSEFFRPEFGSNLASLVFEPYDQVLLDSISYYTIDALQRWEKRIRITNIWFDTSQIDYSQLGIGIMYKIINSQVEGNYVYPFYLQTEKVA